MRFLALLAFVPLFVAAQEASLSCGAGSGDLYDGTDENILGSLLDMREMFCNTLETNIEAMRPTTIRQGEDQWWARRLDFTLGGNPWEGEQAAPGGIGSGTLDKGGDEFYFPVDSHAGDWNQKRRRKHRRDGYGAGKMVSLLQDVDSWNRHNCRRAFLEIIQGCVIGVSPPYLHNGIATTWKISGERYGIRIA